jgi:hypothetical protein
MPPTPTPIPIPTPTPCDTPSPNLNQAFRITAPCDGAKVDPLDFVEGTVSDPNAKVWVIVHPMEIEEYFVQQGVGIREGGKWRVQCHFGEVTAAHKDKHFEIMAVANPKVNLTTGQKLKSWPEAQWKSQVIEVVRK